MALFKFTEPSFAGKSIQVFNCGAHRCDFIFIDDIVEGVFRVLYPVAYSNPVGNRAEPDPDHDKSASPWCVYKVGNNQPVKFMECIAELEMVQGDEAKIELLSLQAGDFQGDYVNVENLVGKFRYKPTTRVEEGINYFVDWHHKDFKA